MATKVIGNNIREAMLKLLHKLLASDVASRSQSAKIPDVTLVAKTCDYELDVGHELWFTKSRWGQLMADYINPTTLKKFLAQAKAIYSLPKHKQNICSMLFKTPEEHTWGGCLLAATFHRAGKHGDPQLTFFSRTSYIGHVGMLDAAIARVMAAEIAPLQSISFRWHIMSAQLHFFKTLPLLLSEPTLRKKLTSSTKPRQQASTTWQQVQHHYKEMLAQHKRLGSKMITRKNCPYAQLQRVYKAWLRMTQGWKRPLPSITVDRLTFKRVFLSLKEMKHERARERKGTVTTI
jgi:hypothetical protein